MSTQKEHKLAFQHPDYHELEIPTENPYLSLDIIQAILWALEQSYGINSELILRPEDLERRDLEALSSQYCVMSSVVAYKELNPMPIGATKDIERTVNYPMFFAYNGKDEVVGEEEFEHFWLIIPKNIESYQAMHEIISQDQERTLAGEAPAGFWTIEQFLEQHPNIEFDHLDLTRNQFRKAGTPESTFQPKYLFTPSEFLHSQVAREARTEERSDILLGLVDAALTEYLKA